VSTQLGHGCSDIWLNSILGVSVKAFLDESNIWIVRQSKADMSGPHATNGMPE
jgi:hypothetical protein